MGGNIPYVQKFALRKLAGALPVALAAAVFSPFAMVPAASAQAVHLTVCHGFACTYRTQLPWTASDRKTIAGYFRGARTPQAERRAISRAVQHFERRSTQVIGVRDAPKSDAKQNGRVGQMDCVDESTNTQTLLRHLAGEGLLKHHAVRSRASRGFLLDGRYFHWTAVVRDPKGTDWAIDSWYEPAGGPPDIMPLEEWKKRGVRGER